MKVAELVLWAEVGWSVIGAVGVVASLRRGRRAEAAKHAAWLVAVAGVYMLVLLGTSILQQQRVVAVGKAQCFGNMCLTVTTVDEVPGLVAGSSDRMVRVTVRVENKDKSADEDDGIETYLVDSVGREWEPLAGLSGNRLNGRVAGESAMVSQPMFRVAKDSVGLGLVLTHGNWQPGRLVIGDSGSLGHRKTIVVLGR